MNSYIVYVIVFLYGIVIGSFLNVCIYRIPEKSSIVFGRSHCMSCNQPIKWYDLVPIFSFLFLRGKCRNCKAKISIQYPVIEALNGFLYVLVFYIYGWNNFYHIFLSIVNCLIISALIVLSVIDFRTNTIPLGINIFILITGITGVIIEYFKEGRKLMTAMDHLIGFFAVSVFLLILFYITKGQGMGGGDIKLMAAAGLALGVKSVLLAFFIGCILGACIHPLRMKLWHKSRVLAFGPYLSAGIMISILFGKQIVDWYIKTFFIS